MCPDTLNLRLRTVHASVKIELQDTHTTKNRSSDSVIAGVEPSKLQFQQIQRLRATHV
jgi:hypothetical protein